MGNIFCSKKQRKNIQTDYKIEKLNDMLNSYQPEDSQELGAKINRDDNNIISDSGSSSSSEIQETQNDFQQIQENQINENEQQEVQQNAQKSYFDFQDLESLKKLQDQYCQTFLDIGNISLYLLQLRTEEQDCEELIFNYEYFQLLMKSVFFWKKIRFEQIKMILIKQRRQILFGQYETCPDESQIIEEPDMSKYKEIQSIIESQEELCIQEVLNEILDKIGSDEQTFERSMNYYQEDPEKALEMREITSITKESMLSLKREYFKDENIKEDILQPAPKISVDQAFIILKFKFAVQLNLAKDMQELKVQLENENGYNFETAQAYFDPLLIDYLWQKTGGIEWEDVEGQVNIILKEQIENQNLEFINVVNSFQEEYQKIIQ